MSAKELLNLNAIEARTNAATGGPWEASTRDLTHPQAGGVNVYAGDAGSVASDGEGYQGACSGPDGEFIAHARTDLPALVARVRELTPRVLKGDWETVRDQLDALPEGAQIRWTTGDPVHVALAIKYTNVLGNGRWDATGCDLLLRSESIARDNTPIEVLP
jgi:hypothetical protein